MYVWLWCYSHITIGAPYEPIRAQSKTKKTNVRANGNSYLSIQMGFLLGPRNKNSFFIGKMFIRHVVYDMM